MTNFLMTNDEGSCALVYWIVGGELVRVALHPSTGSGQAVGQRSIVGYGMVALLLDATRGAACAAKGPPSPGLRLQPRKSVAG